MTKMYEIFSPYEEKIYEGIQRGYIYEDKQNQEMECVKVSKQKICNT